MPGSSNVGKDIHGNTCLAGDSSIMFDLSPAFNLPKVCIALWSLQHLVVNF